MVVLGLCSLVVVMMFQDKFAHLQQLNSPNSQDSVHQVSNMLYQEVFDTILSEFHGILCVLCEFQGILWSYLNFATLRLRKISEALFFIWHHVC